MNKRPEIIGFVTLNDKGQVVIPASARTMIEVKPGDKMLAIVHPSHSGIILVKPDGIEQFAKQMLQDISDAEDMNE
ncbi:MAG TPA: AbrB/MazE/SpoVT family DNA-binding domain-containing protein [Candidatus Saccharimonadia bacterium]|nr:AbrB/MazE/SpoVT family DNA-binding domain-containing protein [Candidatus Saccharimonadia bacterium]